MTMTRPQQEEPLIFERSRAGRIGYSFDHAVEREESAEIGIPAALLREQVDGLPELSEGDVARHFVRLSQWNYGVDTGFYPLGSCTMKYNPKINEAAARLPGFAELHPHMPEAGAQGALQVLWELGEYLKAITGMDAISLQPVAGAQGEFAALKVIRAYLRDRLGDAAEERNKVLIPDTAHGTNPASCSMNGLQVVTCASGKNGILSLAEVERKMNDQVAAIMITNPNTLGKFERQIVEIARVVHERGGMVYADGANLNSFMGWGDVARMGIDAMHINLHKTFSTPHGGGGPGAGPIVVTQALEPFLPVPRVLRRGDRFSLDSAFAKSVGKVHGFFGNFGVLLRAWTYIRELGPEGVREVAARAVTNANYLRGLVEEHYHVPYSTGCMHEFVATDKTLKNGVQTSHVAKRLIDLGFHPPTVYFPLIVKGAMMIEPTETESKETLEAFAEAMATIAREAEECPEKLLEAPQQAVRGVLDEVRAARNPVLKWSPPGEDRTGRARKEK